MERTSVERAMRLLEQAVAMQARTEGIIKEAASVLQSGLSKGNHNGHFSRRKHAAFPYIDHGTFSVRWNGSTCSLGATIPLRLLDRLCRRPNCFVCHESLLQDVWQGARKSHNTVRSTIRRLKRSLESAGMIDLAQSIRCQGGGYALALHKVD
jgi:DNA-binding response OmpR family regulator